MCFGCARFFSLFLSFLFALCRCCCCWCLCQHMQCNVYPVCENWHCKMENGKINFSNASVAHLGFWTFRISNWLVIQLNRIELFNLNGASRTIFQRNTNFDKTVLMMMMATKTVAKWASKRTRATKMSEPERRVCVCVCVCGKEAKITKKIRNITSLGAHTHTKNEWNN